MQVLLRDPGAHMKIVWTIRIAHCLLVVKASAFLLARLLLIRTRLLGYVIEVKRYL